MHDEEIDLDPVGWRSRLPAASNDPELVDQVKAKAQREAQISAAIARWERRSKAKERRGERARRQRDMGLGYLIYACRKGTRRSQRTFAERMGVSPAAVCRWESGTRTPGLQMLQRAAHQDRKELMVGLWDPNKQEVTLLAVIDDELPIAELEMIMDPYQGDLLQPVP